MFPPLVAVLLVTAVVADVPEHWNVTWEMDELEGLSAGERQQVDFWTDDLTSDELRWGIVVVDTDYPGIAKAAEGSSWYDLRAVSLANGSRWSSTVVVEGVFLGRARLRLQLRRYAADGPVSRESGPLAVSVVRPERAIDRAFTISVAVLVSVIYVNFGCALDTTVLRRTLRRPIGPSIGLASQFLFMPLISYLLGLVLFPSSPAMRLGLFFTGVSPAGGASNIWTYALDGNLNLSITMTTLSTIAAFAMMPLWIFSLGHTIFAAASIAVPYPRIATIALSLVIPLGIGILIQQYLPKVSKFMVRILKPFAALLIIFIIVFAIVTNYYLFQLFSWQILLAGMGLPWLGFTCGMLAARAFCQPPEDVLAIAIETGIQNTGIAIFMLRFSLGQPDADLTTVVPVAVAVLTPLPLLLMLLVQRLRHRAAVKRPGPEAEPFGDPNKVAGLSGPATEARNGHP